MHFCFGKRQTCFTVLGVGCMNFDLHEREKVRVV